VSVQRGDAQRPTRARLRAAVFDYIEGWYNTAASTAASATAAPLPTRTSSATTPLPRRPDQHNQPVRQSGSRPNYPDRAIPGADHRCPSSTRWSPCCGSFGRAGPRGQWWTHGGVGRFSPFHCTSRLRPAGGSGSVGRRSLGLKLLCDAYAYAPYVPAPEAAVLRTHLPRHVARRPTAPCSPASPAACRPQSVRRLGNARSTVGLGAHRPNCRPPTRCQQALCARGTTPATPPPGLVREVRPEEQRSWRVCARARWPIACRWRWQRRYDEHRIK